MTNTLHKIKIYGLIVACLFTSLYSLRAQTDKSARYASNSVLSKGTWYKVKIPATGIYKLSYNDLKKMGISNPGKAKVYGYGGWILDTFFTNPYTDDLPQVAIWMSNTPANFGANDYILFYAKGDQKWKYDESKREFVHTQNVYSNDSYYFITESDDEPLLMGNATLSSSATTTVTTFQDYYLHEKELVNIIQSGTEFYGEAFLNNTSQNFSFALPGVTTDAALLRIDFISRTKGSTLDVSLNGTSLQQFSLPTTNFDTDTYTKAKTLEKTVQLANLAENNTLNLAYKRHKDDQNVYLNYLRINYTRTLKPYDAVTLFRSTLKSDQLGFKISNASGNLRVFDVTNGESPEIVNGTLSGTEYMFSASNTSVREYAMVDLSKDIPAPTIVGKIANQDLHSLEPKEMIIIVQPSLQKYAEQLKEIHEAEDGLESLIVNPENIYNEFSSGKPDATAYRRFLKMFYDRAASESDRPKYLLLFGDGTYDNRFVIPGNNWTESTKKMLLLTFQSENSLSETGSYTTDDYFGFLDDYEGSSLSKDSVDIGIGRIAVRTDQEAMDVLKKIKAYIADKDKSIWKNSITFVADDAASGVIASEKQHMKYSEEFAKNICANYPSFIVNRVFSDMYERVTTVNGPRYPDAKKAYMDKINSGTLILNYMGHGSNRDWSHEYILTSSDVEAMSNSRLPLIIIASCDFGRFDGNVTSGSELFMSNSNGGAIALITASRVVYAEQNKKLNDKILEHIFEKKDGKPARLGDIIRHSKQALALDANKLRFLLLGDPALRLSYPDDTYNVKIKEVNNKAATSSDIQLKALSSNVIKGEIVDKDGNIINDFSGILESVIFDSEQSLKTRGNVSNATGNTEAMLDYTDFTNTLYTGKVQIQNGEFTIEFKTPKDILYLNKPGKMSFYAYDDNSSRQAQGYFTNYIVGGTDPDAQEESDAPEIKKIYLNRESFQSGEQVNPTPFFYAEVYDESGINLSSAIGHNISLLIDNSKSYNLTPYFENNGTSTQSGIIKYSIPELEDGMHNLQFKVWDVWNNSQTAHLDFEVVSNYKPTLYDFTIKGNPARTSTEFVLSTDLSGSRVIVTFEVYSMTGAKQWATQVEGNTSMDTYFTHEWNLVTSSGNPLNPGIYICRAIVSVDGSVKATKSEKLIVQGQ